MNHCLNSREIVLEIVKMEVNLIKQSLIYTIIYSASIAIYSTREDRKMLHPFPNS